MITCFYKISLKKGISFLTKGLPRSEKEFYESFEAFKFDFKTISSSIINDQNRFPFNENEINQLEQLMDAVFIFYMHLTVRDLPYDFAIEQSECRSAWGNVQKLAADFLKANARYC